MKEFIIKTAWMMVPPQPYSAFHICITAVGFLIAVLAAYVLSRKMERKFFIRLLFFCGVILTASEIYKQLFLYYLCPFIGALLISGGIAGYISHAFVTYSGVVAPVWSYFGLSLLLFGGMYMIYFIATYIEFKRNILGGER